MNIRNIVLCAVTLSFTALFGNCADAAESKGPYKFVFMTNI